MSKELQMSSEAKTVDVGYPEPTTADLEDPAFEAIWQAIKGWDVARDPTGDGLRSGPTGNDVMHILQRLRALPEPSTPAAATAGDGWMSVDENPLVPGERRVMAVEVLRNGVPDWDVFVAAVSEEHDDEWCCESSDPGWAPSDVSYSMSIEGLPPLPAPPNPETNGG